MNDAFNAPFQNRIEKHFVIGGSGGSARQQFAGLNQFGNVVKVVLVFQSV